MFIRAKLPGKGRRRKLGDGGIEFYSQALADNFPEDKERGREPPWGKEHGGENRESEKNSDADFTRHLFGLIPPKGEPQHTGAQKD